MARAGFDLALNGVRSADQVGEVLDSLREEGSQVLYVPGDLSNSEIRSELATTILNSFGKLNVLINNAGIAPSDRRDLLEATEESYDRVMEVNLKAPYFLTQVFARHMVDQKQQDPDFEAAIINISSISTLTPSPRFSAYVASKSALDAWTRAAAVEYSDRNVRFTNIHMPLVRTPMIEATTVYNSMPVLTPDEAVDMIVEGVIKKPKRIATQMGMFLQILNAVAPKFAEVVMNTVFRMFNDSAAARGDEKPEEVQVSNEQVALAALMKGVHF
jgi:NAD(P)-dependent dehydrogenase (short-subunit alcohol dehydrogenase family)